MTLSVRTLVESQGSHLHGVKQRSMLLVHEENRRLHLCSTLKEFCSLASGEAILVKNLWIKQVIDKWITTSFSIKGRNQVQLSTTRMQLLLIISQVVRARHYHLLSSQVREI
jgi:hypothetical protein